ncbi:uncharacterized protein LOC144434011 [Glandiceps talaboti]
MVNMEDVTQDNITTEQVKYHQVVTKPSDLLLCNVGESALVRDDMQVSVVGSTSSTESFENVKIKQEDLQSEAEYQQAVDAQSLQCPSDAVFVGNRNDLSVNIATDSFPTTGNVESTVTIKKENVDYEDGYHQEITNHSTHHFQCQSESLILGDNPQMNITSEITSFSGSTDKTIVIKTEDVGSSNQPDYVEEEQINSQHFLCESLQTNDGVFVNSVTDSISSSEMGTCKMEDEFPTENGATMDNLWVVTCDNFSSSVHSTNETFHLNKESDEVNISDSRQDDIATQGLCTELDNIQSVPCKINNSACEPFPIGIHQANIYKDVIAETENCGEIVVQVYDPKHAEDTYSDVHSKSEWSDCSYSEQNFEIDHLNTNGIDIDTVLNPSNDEQSKDNPKTLSDNLPTDSKVSSFPCEYCDKCFTGSKYLTKHMKTFHKPATQCVLGRDYFEIDMKTSYIPKRQYETGSGYIEKTDPETKRHKENSNESSTCSTDTDCRLEKVCLDTGTNSYVCNECGKGFCENCSLKPHIKFHSSEKLFVCKECGTGFHTSTNLKTHMANHKRTTLKFVFLCEACNTSFKHAHYLKEHMVRHHKVKQPIHMCHECGQWFFEISELRIHVKIHTNDRPFECQLCGKGFRECDNLKTHMRTHAKIQTFPCQECNTCYTGSDYLRTHMMRQHKVSTFHVCEECGVCFQNRKK